MRTLTKILLMVGLALTMSTSAGAIITVGLSQSGGTYDGISANPGDTLVLDITWNVGAGDTLSLIQAALVFNGAVSVFSPDVYGSPAGLSTEDLYAATFAGPLGPPASKRDMNMLAYGDIAVNPLNPQIALGWEKAAGGGLFVIGPCTAGNCTTLGTAAFILSGTGGIIAVGGVGMPGGTSILDGAFLDIAGNTALVSLGSFTIIPEPTTASLLGLGLLGLTVAGRSRKS
jgi:hypothetical protein